MEFFADGPTFGTKICRMQRGINNIYHGIGTNIHQTVATQEQTLVKSMPVSKTKRLKHIQEKSKDNDHCNKIDSPRSV
jgi:hypothetical protein